ncbi:MAG: amidohydrolase [Myxococcales bacterium]|nr:amidohydrolase [Myxococcales bacterium]
MLQPSPPRVFAELDRLPAPVCAASSPGLLAGPLPALDDEEGPHVPDGLPPLIDGHVHLFPPPLFAAIWRWFDTHGWPIRYRLHAEQVLDFLFSRGVEHVVGLQYAHKPGIADELNGFMAALARAEPRLTGLATVLPGEPGAAALLERAFAEHELRGVKLHCHVQCFAADDPMLAELYEVCVRWDRPLVMHAGREPKSPGYACDPHALCAVERVEQVLRNWPKLRLCVPHFGADEFAGYAALLERHDNLWLDSTMMLADYFPQAPPRTLLERRPQRVLYGTDFPNLPYAWDRELRLLRDYALSPETLEWICGRTARELFAIT